MSRTVATMMAGVLLAHPDLPITTPISAGSRSIIIERQIYNLLIIVINTYEYQYVMVFPWSGVRTVSAVFLRTGRIRLIMGIMKKDHKAIGPYSRLFRVGITASSVDGRSEAGRYLRDAEKQLADHVGGKPSVAQKMLITRLAMISLRLHLLDQKALAGTDWTDLDSRTHGGLSSALRHGLRELGMKAAAAEPPSIAEHLAKRRAAGGDAAA